MSRANRKPEIRWEIGRGFPNIRILNWPDFLHDIRESPNRKSHYWSGAAVWSNLLWILNCNRVRARAICPPHKLQQDPTWTQKSSVWIWILTLFVVIFDFLGLVGANDSHFSHFRFSSVWPKNTDLRFVFAVGYHLTAGKLKNEVEKELPIMSS